MTKEQLEAIRQRVHNKNWMDPIDGIDSNQPRIDRAALLEEVDRLRTLADGWLRRAEDDAAWAKTEAADAVRAQLGDCACAVLKADPA